VVSSGLDNFLIIWNVATGEPLRRLYGHDDAVKRVAFFNDSTAILSCGGDNCLKVWYLTPQPPAAPGKPRISNKSTQSMTIAWKAPPAFNEEISAFHIQYRVGIREPFSHDITAPGDEHSFIVKGLRASTPYQFRVRGVNRMGEGRWSDPSPQTVTAIDVPDAFERPEVLEVTPFAIGIKWRAPTATIEGTSIGRFVVQLAGAGLSYEDKVQQVITWADGRAHLVRYEERQAAIPEKLRHLGVGQTSNRNLEILLENRVNKQLRLHTVFLPPDVPFHTPPPPFVISVRTSLIGFPSCFRPGEAVTLPGQVVSSREGEVGCGGTSCAAHEMGEGRL
jgi:hypothetical protein